MKLVYIAGPYRAATPSGIRRNIEAARAVAEQVWAQGHAAICPHLNTAFMDGITPDQVFLEGDLESMRRCDCVLLVDGWERSEGTRREVLAAVDGGKDVYRDITRFNADSSMFWGQIEKAMEGWAKP